MAADRDDTVVDRYGQYVRLLLLLNVVAWTFTLGLGAYLWGVL